MSQHELRIDVVPPGSFSYLAQSGAVERLPTPEVECTTNRVECSRLATPIYSYKVAFPRLIPESPTLTDDDKETFLRNKIPCEMLYDRDGFLFTTNKLMILSFAGVTQAKEIPCMAELEEVPAAYIDYATLLCLVIKACGKTLGMTESYTDAFNTAVFLSSPQSDEMISDVLLCHKYVFQVRTLRGRYSILVDYERPAFTTTATVQQSIQKMSQTLPTTSSKIEVIGDHFSGRTVMCRRERRLHVVFGVEFSSDSSTGRIGDVDVPPTMFSSAENDLLSAKNHLLLYTFAHGQRQFLFPEDCLLQLSSLDTHFLSPSNMPLFTTCITILPKKLLENIRQLLAAIVTHERECNLFARWGFELAKSLARHTVLDYTPPGLTYGGGQDFPAPKDGIWHDLSARRMLKAPNLTCWLVVSSLGQEVGIMAFIASLLANGTAIGLGLTKPDIIFVNYAKDEWRSRVLDLCVSQTMYVLFFVDTRRLVDYAALSTFAMTQLAIPFKILAWDEVGTSALVQHHEIQRLLNKMGAELGGVPWRLKQLSPFSAQKSIMCVGLHVLKDWAKGIAITAVAGSLNDEKTLYFTNSKVHSLGDVGPLLFPSQFADHLTEAVCAYEECNQRLPKAIVIYGRGVDGAERFGAGLSRGELSKIRECFSYARPGNDYHPLYSYTLVDDKCRLRIFRHENRSPCVTNPLCGMSVKELDYGEIVLVSEKMNHGTLSPTSYQSVEDFIGLDERAHVELALDLCHLNYADPSSSRIPAPLVYAEKLCRLRSLTDATPPSSWQNKYYYL